MFLVDYKPSLQRELDRKEGYEDGFAEGEAAGFSKGETAGFSKGEASGFSKGEAAGFSKGEASGFSKGEAAGFSRGEASGMEKGEYIKLIALIRRKIQKQKTLEQIANELEEPAEEIGPFYDLLIKQNQKNDEEIYYLYQKSKAVK